VAHTSSIKANEKLDWNLTYLVVLSPLPPPAPLARRCTPTSVTLTWRNDEGYEKRLAQLKKVGPP
jgi:hypothetical protein